MQLIIRVLFFIIVVFFFYGCSSIRFPRPDLEDAYKQGVRDALTQKGQKVKRAEIPDGLKGGNFVGNIRETKNSD